jgi:8-oxo-dGTP diphosphatase
MAATSAGGARGRANSPVRAAGGVVWRRDDHGVVEVVLVHRPHYDDWSLPKGKLDPGESDEEAALREVEEETGLRGRLETELSSTRYKDRDGRDKIVRYWSMPVDGGQISLHHEVDDARWVPADKAKRMLTYQRDAAVIDDLLKTLD